MKKSIRFLLLLCVFSLVATLFGCQERMYGYTFAQTTNKVTKVEACWYDHSQFADKRIPDPFLVLEGEEAKEIVEDITDTVCFKYQENDEHPDGYGDIVLIITYANGERELLGKLNCANITTDGSWNISGYYFCDSRWDEVLSEVIFRMVEN